MIYKMDNEKIISKLYDARIKEDINDIFIKNKITTIKDKINLLNECMEITATYYHGGDNENENELTTYNRVESLFIRGTWRLLHSKNA